MSEKASGISQALDVGEFEGQLLGTTLDVGGFEGLLRYRALVVVSSRVVAPSKL